MRIVLPLLLTALLASPATALAQDEPPSPPEPEGAQSEEVYAESVVEEFRVGTDYGSLYGWVRRPVVPAGVKVPVILTYSPYAALEAQGPGQEPLSSGISDFYVPRGYARAFVHLVGTGNSGGCTDYGGLRERKTAYSVVEYLGTRDWSNGRVGMVGGSYDGTTQWAAAIESPPHLATIVPQVAISRWYDYAFQAGVRYASGSGTPILFSYGFGQIPTPQTLLTPDAATAFADNARPCDEVEQNERAFLPDPVYDEFWDERDYVSQSHRVRASVLLEGSWTDYNVHPVNSARMWAALPAGLPAHFHMGQQGHGDASFENAARIRHAWFDHWLLGLNSGVLAVPRVYSDAAVSNDADSTNPDSEVLLSELWPPRGTTARRLALAPAATPDGLALADGDSEQWTDTDPQLSEGTVLAGGAPDESVLFVGQQLPAELRVAGEPALELAVTTSATETFVVAVLFDERPDGEREVITRGSLNSRNRDGERVSTPIEPGSTWRGRLRFQPVDHVLRRGHKLGVAVMSMNASDVLYPDTTRATNALVLAESALALPVAPRVEAPAPVATPGPALAPSPARLGPVVRVGKVRRRGRRLFVPVRCLLPVTCRVTATARGARRMSAAVRGGRSKTLKLTLRGRRAPKRVAVRATAGGRTTRVVRSVRRR